MKQILYLILVVLSSTAWAQATLEIDGQTIAGTSLGGGRWQFSVGGESFLLIQEEDVKGLAQKVRELQADSIRSQELIAAKDELLQAFDGYEQNAKSYIDVQERALATADSLYRGYEQLYQDSKRLWDTGGFSIIPGVGLVSPESGNILVGSLGLGYQGFQGSVQLGKNYEGVILGYRLNLFR